MKLLDKFRTLFVLFGFLLFLSGCYLNSSISRHNDEEALPQPSTSELSKMSFVEVVSASNNYQANTASGYKVRQSAGVILGRQVFPTNGTYKVYSLGAGRILSEEMPK